MPRDNSIIHFHTTHNTPCSPLPTPRKGTYFFQFLVGTDNNVKQKMGEGGGLGLYYGQFESCYLNAPPLPPCQSVTGLHKFTQRSP